MKTTSSSHKYFQSMLATLAIAVICGISAPPAQAGYIVTLQQLGPDVVATGTGTIDYTDLTLFGTNSATTRAELVPSQGVVDMGLAVNPAGNQDLYTGYSGPTSFGSGGQTFADLGSGDHVFITPQAFHPDLGVPTGYVSGAPLLSSDTYSGQTFSSLGVKPGTYVWTWGTGMHADSFTLIAVPDSGSTLGLLFVSLMALFGISRFRSLRLA
jgi:VPDSG-CTERM motif